MERDPGTELSVTQAQLRFAKALAEILVYIVVLNLFAQFVHAVVIESFSVSLVTAVLLRLMLGATVRLERRVADHFREKQGVVPRVLRYLCAWASSSSASS